MRGLSFVLVVLCCAAAEARNNQTTQIVTGGRNDDTVTTHAILGEAKIAQDFEAAGTGATGPNGETLRADDPDDPVDAESRTYFPRQPLEQQTKVTLVGLQGADEFLIRTYISGKPAIVAQHVGEDDVIDWNGVAGENNNVHDHWVDYFGTVTIGDFNADEGDTLRVQGHTVALNSLAVIDGNTCIVVQSQQGNGGGAHDEDILGTIIVQNAELTEDDITFTHSNDGLTRTYGEFLALVDEYQEILDEQLEEERAEEERQRQLQELLDRWRSRFRGRFRGRR